MSLHAHEIDSAADYARELIDGIDEQLSKLQARWLNADSDLKRRRLVEERKHLVVLLSLAQGVRDEFRPPARYRS